MNPRDSYRFFEISKIYGSSCDNILTCVAYGNKFDESWLSNKDKFDRYDMISIVEDISNMNCQYQPKPPGRIWGLIGSQEHKIPENYRLCVFPTNLEEDLYSELIKRDNENIAKPGIYIIFAIPDKITPKSLPVRRLFCRPKVFCNQ